MQVFVVIVATLSVSTWKILLELSQAALGSDPAASFHFKAGKDI